MIRFDQWALPTGETHLAEWMTTKRRRVDGRLTYQYEKYEAALGRCPSRRVAIDVGSHCGLWAFWMARDFERVHCFEPKPEHQECWITNMTSRHNAELYDVALGAIDREVGLITGPSSSGDTAVDLSASGIQMRTLDSYHFQGVDFIKVDCEGYEAFVLEGGLETLKRCRPVVIVEQKTGHGPRFGRGDLDAVRLLESLGARQVWDYSGDYVLTFEKAA